MEVHLFRLGFLVGHCLYVDGIRWDVFPILLVNEGRSDSDLTAIGTESEGRDVRWVAMKLAQALFVEAIPHIDVAVRTPCGESVVAAMEGNAIHRVDQLDAVAFLDSMALESILFLLDFSTGIKIFNSHTT